MHKFCRPFYRLLQRAMVLEAVRVMMARTENVSALARETEGVDTFPLDREQLRTFIERGEAPHCESLVERLGDPRMYCVGAVAGGKLVSFAWFHQGSAEGEMNYGRTKATATPILLEPDAAFVFHAYTSPEARGRGLLSAVITRAASVLREMGVESLVTTTEVVNDAARAAFHRAGFRDVGTYWRFGLGKKVFGSYPQLTPPIVAYDPR